MTASRVFASGAAFFEFAAWRWAPFVDAANGFFAGFAIQRRAARRAVVGAAHAAGVFGEGGGQACGHIATAFFVFEDREIHAKAHAASAAGGAVGHDVKRVWTPDQVRGDRQKGVCGDRSGSHAAQQQKLHQRFLHMHAVFGFVPHDRLRAVDDFGADFFAPVGGQAVHEEGVWLG